MGLATGGASQEVSGVGCPTKAAQAEVQHWSVGGVRLPTDTVSVLRLGGSSGSGSGPAIAGLLGSDVLSRFGEGALDYSSRRLRLGAQAVRLGSSTAHSIKVRVVRREGAALALAPSGWTGAARRPGWPALGSDVLRHFEKVEID